MSGQHLLCRMKLFLTTVALPDLCKQWIHLPGVRHWIIVSSLTKKKIMTFPRHWDHLDSGACSGLPHDTHPETRSPCHPYRHLFNTHWLVTALLKVDNFWAPVFHLVAPALFSNLSIVLSFFRISPFIFEISPHLCMHHSIHHEHASPIHPLAPSNWSGMFQPLLISWANTQSPNSCTFYSSWW